MRLNKKGQALIESMMVALLMTSFFTFFLMALATAVQIFIWHQKVNQALICTLDERKTTSCLQDFNRTPSDNDKMIFLRLVKFKFQRIQQRPSIEIELKGFFDEIYPIRKKLSSKNWRV